MPDQPKSDIVMMFKLDGGQPVYAECALDLNPSDRWMTEFKPQTYERYSNFFEVSKFHFGFEVKDEDKSRTKLQSGDIGGAMGKTRFGRVEGEFASWRSMNDEDLPNARYPLEFESFTFERVIDAASMVFFEHCCNSTTFPSATLIKRVSVGGNEAPMSYLKMEFKDVLITGLSWDDGDMTTEKCEFICRNFALSYRQQRPDGSFGARVPAEWDHIKNAVK